MFHYHQHLHNCVETLTISNKIVPSMVICYTGSTKNKTNILLAISQYLFSLLQLFHIKCINITLNWVIIPPVWHRKLRAHWHMLEQIWNNQNRFFFFKYDYCTYYRVSINHLWPLVLISICSFPRVWVYFAGNRGYESGHLSISSWHVKCGNP